MSVDSGSVTRTVGGFSRAMNRAGCSVPTECQVEHPEVWIESKVSAAAAKYERDESGPTGVSPVPAGTGKRTPRTRYGKGE